MKILAYCLMSCSILMFLSGCTSVQSRWEKAISADTIEAYSAFLSEFPDCEYVPTARARLEELQWDQVCADPTTQSVERFMKEWPDSKHIPKAQAALEELYWLEARRKSTTRSLEGFIARWPKNEHAPEAKAGIQVLRGYSPVEDSDLDFELMGIEGGSIEVTEHGYRPNPSSVDRLVLWKPSGPRSKTGIDIELASRRFEGDPEELFLVTKNYGRIRVQLVPGPHMDRVRAPKGQGLYLPGVYSGFETVIWLTAEQKARLLALVR